MLNDKLRDISSNLDITTDILRNVSKIEIISNDTIYIQNYKEIALFTDNDLHVDCNGFRLMITGFNISLKSLTDEFISVFGKFTNIEFSKVGVWALSDFYVER